MEPQNDNFLTEPKQRKGYLTVILTIIIIILIGGLVALGIMYKDAKSQAANAANSSDAIVDSQSKGELKTVSVKSIGYPYEMPNDSINTTLVLPNYIGAVNTKSTVKDSGATAGYTSKYNDEMGRWQIGYLSEDVAGSHSGISLVEISEAWLNTTSDNTQIEVPVTPADKSAFLASLKSRTADCVKDDSTGFITDGKVINICFTVDPGRDSYSPRIDFEGYAELKERPFYLAGNVRLYDGLTADYNKRWKKISVQTIADFKDKKYPAETRTQIDNLISALSKTEVTVTDRVR